MESFGHQSHRYIVGIDLGTTNCAVAFVDTFEQDQLIPPVRLFRVPQLVGPGMVEEQELLPSFCYHAIPGEFVEHEAALP